MPKPLRFTIISALFLALTVEAWAFGAHITRISDKKQVTLAQLVARAERADLVLIGEAHDNPTHHAMELSLISTLWSQKLPLAIGLEMIQADSQQALDDWSAGKLSEQAFLRVYARNWSLDWGLYRDIFLFARDNHIPMVGLNIPKEIAVKVARQGFESLSAGEKKDLPEGTTCDLNTPHTAFLKRSFQEVFKHASNGSSFTYFCEAQTLRNSGMALNIERYVQKHPGRKVVALAGLWHAVKNAIPDQLERKGSKMTDLVILPELPEISPENVTPEIADYMIGW
jgi:uncharacterized iron-regulated protein